MKKEPHSGRSSPSSSARFRKPRIAATAAAVDVTDRTVEETDNSVSASDLYHSTTSSTTTTTALFSSNDQSLAWYDCCLIALLRRCLYATLLGGDESKPTNTVGAAAEASPRRLLLAGNEDDDDDDHDNDCHQTQLYQLNDAVTSTASTPFDDQTVRQPLIDKGEWKKQNQLQHCPHPHQHDDYNSLDFSETSLTDEAFEELDDDVVDEVLSERGKAEKDDVDLNESTAIETETKRTFHLSDFERHCILGAGQFGQVWLVSEKAQMAQKRQHASPTPSQPKSTSVYALKVHAKYDLIASDEVDTILRERSVMHQLNNHPFIVQLMASFQDEHLVYLLQEFCQGGELFSVLHHQNAIDGCLPETQAAFYALCLADALLYMHSAPHNIVYRDLKPENVMLDRNGYPKLIDMGYAKTLTADSDYQTFTFCGTPRYLAPETVTSGGSSFGVDHWALGILVYEMVVGESPFYWEGIDEPSLFASIAEEDYPAPPSTVSSAATDLIARLLVKDPTQRLGYCNGGNDNSNDTDSLSLLVQHHAWFDNFDLDAMRAKRVEAPWIPTLHSVLDAGCFDDWSDELEDRVAQSYPTLMSKEQSLFAAFG